MKKASTILTAALILLVPLFCPATEVVPDDGIGMKIGSTTRDEQHPARMARQIAWRHTDNLHFVWYKKIGKTYSDYFFMTSYQVWDATSYGSLVWSPDLYMGGKDLHAAAERSKYPGIDAMSDGRALIGNTYDIAGMGWQYQPTAWSDYYPIMGMFAMRDLLPEEQMENTPCETDYFSWPYICFHLYDNGSVEDTIIHILAKEHCNAGSGAIDEIAGELRYFRRLGGPHIESPYRYWDDYKVIDTTYMVGYCVEAMGEDEGWVNPGKVAIVWTAHWPATTGDGESAVAMALASEKSRECNDVYIMVSADGGESWSPKYNVTKNDSLSSGWTPLSDISALIDTDGRLHVVYAARKFENTNGGLPQLAENMNWPQYPMASRIFHWSDEGEPVGSALDDNYISVVKDMNLLWDNYPDVCPGGAWSSMSLTKPMISQCDDKLYVLFSQYQDPQNGMADNCHIKRYNGSYYDGAANATLHLSVSDMANGGMNWDPARMLTDFTPRCDTGSTSDPLDPVDPDAITVCHNHGWPSMARFGMKPGNTSDFDNAIIVNDPSWSQTGSPGFYLDVLYVDDLYPGNIWAAEGSWTVNPMKWFRVPCIDEEAGGTISPGMLEIYEPNYSGNPGQPIVYTVTVENIGNVPLDIIINTEEINNIDPAIDGWLYVDPNGYTNPLSHIPPDNTHDFLVIVNHNGVVDVPYVPTTLQGAVKFESPSRAILYELPIEHLIPGPSYICGDFDGQSGINILDIVYLINYIYKNGPEPIPLQAADLDGTPNINILDIVYLINYIYKNGPDPDCS